MNIYNIYFRKSHQQLDIMCTGTGTTVYMVQYVWFVFNFTHIIRFYISNILIVYTQSEQKTETMVVKKCRRYILKIDYSVLQLFVMKKRNHVIDFLSLATLASVQRGKNASYNLYTTKASNNRSRVSSFTGREDERFSNHVESYLHQTYPEVVWYRYVHRHRIFFVPCQLSVLFGTLIVPTAHGKSTWASSLPSVGIHHQTISVLFYKR